jgi:hypothetical protein
MAIEWFYLKSGAPSVKVKAVASSTAADPEVDS